MGWLGILSCSAAAFIGLKFILKVRKNFVHLQALNTCRDYVGFFRETGGVPEGFWNDPYVLGYLQASVAYAGKAATNNKIGQEDLGLLFIQFVKEMGGDWQKVGNLIKTYHASKNSVFEEGFKNGEKVFCVTTGLNTFDSDPDVIKAKEKLNNQSTADYGALVEAIYGTSCSEESSLGAILSEDLYFKRVLSRLGDDRVRMFADEAA